MIHASLFSGIGGFDLAAEWMGWDNLFHCEWNAFGQKVLKYHFPKSIPYHDITKTDFTIHRGAVDVLTGGFPCQPYSQAGKRLGKEDERHLWPEMLRAVREIQPGWVVGENVLGLVNWNGGLVFDEVQADLEAAGYEVWAYVLPACGVNAPHRRDRVWFVAHSSDFGCNNGCYNREKGCIQTTSQWFLSKNKSEWNGRELGACETCAIKPGSNANPAGERLEKPRRKSQQQKNDARQRVEYSGLQVNATNANGFGLRGQSHGFGKPGQFGENSTGNYWHNFPTQSPVCDGDDGFSAGLDGITFSKWRNESIKAGGNAIVPQVALQIFKAIEQYRAL